MAMPPEHTTLLQRNDFPVAPAGNLDDQERDLLSRYGYWLEALSRGELAPITPEQERFVRVARGQEEPRSAFEIAWLKQQRAVLPRPSAGPLEVSERLDRLQAARLAAAAVQEEYDRRRAAIMESVQPLLETLDAEFADRLRATNNEVARLQGEARDAVLNLGASFRHRDVHAVFVRGRVTWDTKGLSRYAETHPEVAEFRREGKPTVSFRFQPLPGVSATGPAAEDAGKEGSSAGPGD
jgi:hypothetical protein